MSSTETLTRLPLLRLPSPVLPGATITLSLNGEEVRAAVEAATDSADGRLVLVGGDERMLGVTARVPNVGNLPGGEPAAIVVVDGRARIVATHATPDKATSVDVEIVIDPPTTPRVEAAERELRATLELIAELRRSRRLPEILRTVGEPGALADAVAMWAEFGDDDRLRVLQAVDVGERVDALHSWAGNYLRELQVAETIRSDVSEGMDRQQREFLLRQQMNSIRKELGEGDDDVVGEYRDRLADMDAPDSAKTAIDKELDRFERMSTQSPEHSWIRTWLDRVFEMPWGVRSEEHLDLDAARQILDADHYGLDDVKDRFVEFLATRKLRRERGLDERVDADGSRAVRGQGAIITLIGPPGVGKTSLGESVARAMGREFVRVALGGIRDEAEIRGHRRTYVGSQPGRIVRALHESGTMNPVILLDEVDKLAAGGWSGDPTAALLDLTGQPSVEAASVEVPALAVGIEDEVVVAELVVAPCRRAARAGLVALSHERREQAEGVEQLARIRGNRLADALVLVAAGLRDQYARRREALVEQAQRSGTPRRPPAQDQDLDLTLASAHLAR